MARRAHRRDAAAEIAQGVELMHTDLAQGAAGRTGRIPAPVLAREPHTAIVGKIGLDLADLAELAGIDRPADRADPCEQPRAMADRDVYAVRALQRRDRERIRHGVGDRLLDIDVLAGARGALRDVEMQLVW